MLEQTGALPGSLAPGPCPIPAPEGYALGCGTLTVGVFRTFDTALGRLAAACDADPACRAAYPDVDETFARVVARLNAEAAVLSILNLSDGRSYAPKEYPIARALSGEIIIEEEMRYRRGDGRLTTFAVSAAPLRNEDGEILAAVGTFTDIHARKQAEAELTRLYTAEQEARAAAEAAIQVRNTFLAIAAHELRTSLTAIHGHAQLLQRRLAGQEVITERDRRAVRTIADQATRAHQLIESLLDVGRLQLDGGTITVGVAQDEDAAIWTVRDEGIGISAAAREKLFQRFYRAENATSLPISGLGIGLYVVQQLVTLHGGSVDVVSELGRGSTFTVRLPRAATGDSGATP